MIPTEITTVSRASAYEVHVTYQDGSRRSCAAVYRQALGRYSPPMSEADSFFDAALAANPAAKITNLNR